ncbi:hypothetical protein [Sphingomonas sp. RIT328]|uniref:hypothetical protein n=1 Tax=Sphingomonas sp. RIT328 TaxID=1470591 RepID=UPI001267D250|nr:hypothetical protein [Sphingomonas sp. RIT328]
MAADEDLGRFLQSVAERDIDLLLMEELHADPLFVRFVAGLAGFGAEVVFDGAWHSLCDEDGETDLLLRLRLPDERVGLLIENKIAAPAQDEQDLRYHVRGRRAQEAGRFDRFVTAICAPRVYLGALPTDTAYEHFIPYEAIRDWFLGRDDARSKWRAAIMREAVEQGRRGYVMKVHAGKTAFHMAYWLLMQERHPQFLMVRPGPKGPKSDWIRYRRADFPKGVTLNHKADQCCVELEFARTTVDELLERRDVDWPKAVRVLARGGSAALSVVVPKVDMGGPFEPQRKLVQMALDAGVLLAPFAHALR